MFIAAITPILYFVTAISPYTVLYFAESTEFLIPCNTIAQKIIKVHCGERTLASWLDNKNVPLETIQLILGHEDPDMNLTYIDPNFERIQAAFDKTLINIK